MREAREWTQRPGQSSTLAVLVTEPSKPDNNDDQLPELEDGL
jgi:hypothetical protein